MEQKSLEKLDSFVTSEYENEKGVKTIKSYKQEVNYFLDWLPDVNEKNLKSTLIDFKEHLQEKYKPATCNHYIVVVNKFLFFCGYEERLKKLKIQHTSSLNNQLEEIDHKRMLRWAKNMGLDDMYLIMKLFAKSGIRVMEIKYFTVEELNWSMEIYNKGKYREIIIPNDLVRELRKYCRENKIRSGYIFKAPKDPSKPLSASTIWERLKRIAKRAKINPNKIHPHAWRHLFAKNAKEAGIDLDELSDLLGHNNLNTTAIYTKTSSKEKRKKLERMR